MKKQLMRLQEVMCLFLVWGISFPVWADLPVPPDGDWANGSKDWIDVGGSLTYRILTIVCIALGVIILVSVASGIVKAYATAHERQDLGHFFKMLVVGLVCAALGVGLVYGGFHIIPTSS